MKSFLTLLVLGITITISQGEVGAPFVRIPQGRLAGTIERSRDGRPFYAYRGIPYGKVETRFEPAIPAGRWNGTLQATAFGPICPQNGFIDGGIMNRSEDCLSINVFAPANRPTAEKLPVMVWIYGGALQFGFADQYTPEFLIDEGVIMVSMNYRVGIFGFLSTRDDVIQGNMGLKDQVLALHWVQENIGRFGGDKGRVTIFGESAGSSSVMYHIISEQSRGLFHNAIGTSGSALNFPCIPNQIYKVAEALKCPNTKNTTLIVQCLRNADMLALQNVNLETWNLDPFVPFTPVVEVPRRNQDPSELFLKEDPLTSLEQGRFAKVPLLSGVNENEGLVLEADFVMGNPKALTDMNTKFSEVAPQTFNLYMSAGKDAQQSREVTQAIRKFYFGQKQIGNETYEELGNVYSDTWFLHGIRKQLIEHARHGGPLYAFMLGFHRPSVNPQRQNPHRPNQTGHADDLSYYFPKPFFGEPLVGDEQLRFSRKMVNIYTTFAKTGGVPVDNWRRVSQNEVKDKAISWYNLKLYGSGHIQDPFTKRMAFWDSIKDKFQEDVCGAPNGIKRGKGSNGVRGSGASLENHHH